MYYTHFDLSMRRGGASEMKKLMVLMAIFGLIGCAGPEKQLKMTEGGSAQDAGQPAAVRAIVFPNGTILGGASAAQMSSLAEIFVDSHNTAMSQMDKSTKAISEGQKQIQISTLRIEESVKKNLETAQQSLALIEQISKKQGSGEITLFFDRRAARLGSQEISRLVSYLDYLARESRGRKVFIVSIGSASAIGNAKLNTRLAQRRAECPLPVIGKYLVNIPHEIYKVYGTGDIYSPKNISLKQHQKYQYSRIIAYYETDQLPKLPEPSAKP
jgi:hypothetical protein